MGWGKTGRSRGFVLGMVGGLAGVAAMESYTRGVAPWVESKLARRSGRAEESPLPEAPETMSPFQRRYRTHETAPTTLGRVLYRRVAGREPESQQARVLLNYALHSSYGALMGGVYGALRPAAGLPDIRGGIAWGVTNWLLGQELGTAFLGLERSPARVFPADHVNRLGMHLAYGAALAAVTQALRRLTSRGALPGPSGG